MPENVAMGTIPGVSLHKPQLDGLRALAVLAVTWGHWTSYGRIFWDTSVAVLGVQLFFVLSGFLITGILLDIRARSETSTQKFYALRQFYFRRALRLFPLLYLIIFLAILLQIPPFPESWPWHAFYLSNFYQYKFGWVGFGSNLWTLAVEEQFYLCWPLFILFLPRKLIHILLVCIILVAPLTRWYVWSHAAPIVEGFRKGDPNLLPFAAFDCLAVGAMLSIADRRWIRWSPTIFARSGLIIGLTGYCLIHVTGFCLAFEQICFALVCTWFVWNGSLGFSGCFGAVLELRPIQFIGRISYGVYVIQGFSLAFWNWWLYSAPVPGYRVFARLGVDEGVYTSAIFTVVSQGLLNIVLAIISWKFLESPINGLKRYFPYFQKRDRDHSFR